jgi:hypothetical protein
VSTLRRNARQWDSMGQSWDGYRASKLFELMYVNITQCTGKGEMKEEIRVLGSKAMGKNRSMENRIGEHLYQIGIAFSKPASVESTCYLYFFTNLI